MAFIEDPQTGLKANVSGKKGDAHLLTEAIDIDFIAHNSQEDELTFAWISDFYNYCAADTILLVQNTDSDRALKIHKMTTWTDTSSRLTVHTTDSASLTPAGTTVTGVNLNRTSGKTALATAIRDETANVQGNIIGEFYAEANKTNDWDFDDAVILGNGQSIAADLVTAGTGAIVAFYGFYEVI